MISRDQVTEAVHSSVETALGVEAEEVTASATLLDDLGAESIDLLDILFRIERAIGVKIQAAELAEYVQGGIPDDEFGDVNEIVTPTGLAQLKKIMPQIDQDALSGKLAADKVMSLFTVDNLVQLVTTRTEAADTVSVGA
jgi:acyl carrier protein